MRSTLPAARIPARRRPRRLTWTLRATTAIAAVGALAVTSLGASGRAPGAGDGDTVRDLRDAAATVAAPAKRATNPVTPGDFRGYGFDQCLAPSQSAMDAWLNYSPFLAVGIYISGDSRACRNQPNLTPTWVSTQLANGWRLLPITLGPQASCQPRFPRYSDDFKISPQPGKNGTYTKARTMGQNSATQAVADARALGIVEGSTLWYDLEGFDASNTDCRESALAFLSAWTTKVKSLGFVSGVYSSASSGIKALDQARTSRAGAFTLPDQIWIADWDGKANTSSVYVSESGWRPGGRMKQYRGGHDETWGGVRINIDSNMLDLGNGGTSPAETHCDGTNISFASYTPLRARQGDTVSPSGQVKAAQCLLTERGFYNGPINGNYHAGFVKAVDAWHAKRGFPADGRWWRRDWISALSWGQTPVLKTGSTGYYVRRAQRTLNAADLGSAVKVTGVFDAATTALLKTYQKRTRLQITGNVTPGTWQVMAAGKR